MSEDSERDIEFRAAMSCLAERDQLVEWINRHRTQVENLADNGNAAASKLAQFTLLELSIMPEVEWEFFDEDEEDEYDEPDYESPEDYEPKLSQDELDELENLYEFGGLDLDLDDEDEYE